MPSEVRARRVRRTPADARRLILDAAERCMGADGPASLRLTQVAAAAGVSHPTLLHHFGSRAGLVRALAERAILQLRHALAAMLAGSSGDGDVVGLVFAAYRDGLAQRLVWVMQLERAIQSERAMQSERAIQSERATESGRATGSDRTPHPAGSPALAEVSAALHQIRQRLAPQAVLVEADTRAVVHLTAVAAFGDALLGPRLRGEADEPAARAQFEQWFRMLLSGYLAGAATP